MTDFSPLNLANGPAATAGESALDNLLLRMQQKGDFPALSASVARIIEITSSERESVARVSEEILRDVTLTQKLLRLVNSVHYAHMGRGAISSVSRAVALVGFDAVRNMALSLVLLEHLQDPAQVGQMKEEFLRALFAGMLASEWCASAHDAEEAFIGGVFQNLGRMLSSFYFPHEAAEIRELVAAGVYAGGEDSAAFKVLGVTLEEFGSGIARLWGLPPNLIRHMRKPVGAAPLRPVEPLAERLRWTVFAANHLADALLQAVSVQRLTVMRTFAQRYTRPLALEPGAFEAGAERARLKLVQLAEALDIAVAPESAAARLLAKPVAAPPAAPAVAPAASAPTPAVAPVAAPAPVTASAPLAAPAAPVSAPASVSAFGELRALDVSRSALLAASQGGGNATPSPMARRLQAGHDDAAQALARHRPPSEVVPGILQALLEALQMRRIVVCLRDKADHLVGRAGLGEGHEAAVRALRVPLKAPGDVFATVCNRGTDTLISDAAEPRMAARLPAWYKAGLDAPAFLLLPLMHADSPMGLIYADRAVAGGIAGLGERELALVRALRAQAVAALRQVA